MADNTQYWGVQCTKHSLSLSKVPYSLIHLVLWGVGWKNQSQLTAHVHESLGEEHGWSFQCYKVIATETVLKLISIIISLEGQ